MSNVYQNPISATLARRLAEAADGFRNLDEVFFIAQYQYPYTVLDFLTLAAAEQKFNDDQLSPNDYGIFGPYKTLDDVYTIGLRGVEDITSVEMKIHFKDGGYEERTLPGGIDSIFFNLSSLDKFIFPYYCHVYGADYAKKLRDDIIIEYKKNEKQSISSMPKLPPGGVHPGGTALIIVSANQ
jgi:hypothetical protein